MRLHHPLWTHTPALLLGGLATSAFWKAWPLPDPAPVHFGANGLPDRWGSPWEMPIVILFVVLITIGISFAVDESWARTERRKRFNWFALVDELFIALLAAVALQYVAAVAEQPYLNRSSWTLTAGLMIVSGLMGATLEILRPVRLATSTEQPSADSLEEELDIGDISGKKWAYWESQNPRYTRWYIPGFGIGLLALALSSWDSNRWAASTALVMGLVVLLTCAGGFRTSITRERLTLRGGLVGLPLLRLRLVDIDRAEVHTFSPLADFGGYGIRRNRQMKAFFLQGNTGVRLTTVSGDSYLLGSEQPARLAAVVRAAVSQTKSRP